MPYFSSSSSSSSSMTYRAVLAAFMLLPLACGDENVGDDLPPGAFTSGPEDSGPVDTGSDDSTTDPVTTVDPTTTTTSSDDDTDDSGGSDTMIPMNLNHQDDILPIWEVRCGDSSCHDPDAPVFGLDLVSDGVYDRICSASHALSGMPYIDCAGGDPQNSYIFRKIEGTHLEVSGGGGTPMPPDSSMTDEEILLVETWIMSGAPDMAP